MQTAIFEVTKKKIILIGKSGKCGEPTAKANRKECFHLRTDAEMPVAQSIDKSDYKASSYIDHKRPPRKRNVNGGLYPSAHKEAQHTSHCASCAYTHKHLKT